MASRMLKAANVLRKANIRPSTACPPEYLKALCRTSIISAPQTSADPSDESGCDKESISSPRSNRGDQGLRGDNVLILGAGRLGRALVKQMLKAGAKGLAIVDKNPTTCKALFQEIAHKHEDFPRSRTTFYYKISDINAKENIEETLQEATTNLGGHMDIVIDATGVTKEENMEDTLMPSTMACNHRHLKCLERTTRLITFGSPPGLTQAMFKDTLICKDESISMMGMREIPIPVFVSMVMERIQKSKLLLPNGKVVISFSKPELLDGD